MRICAKFNLTVTFPFRQDNHLMTFDFDKKQFVGQFAHFYLDNYFLMRKDEYV